MAYGEKYKSEFESWDGVAWVITISKLNYTGSSNDIDCGREPFRITWGGKDDYLNPIHGSECELTLIAPSDYYFIDLYTPDARAWQVVITRDGSTFWSGYILPEKYGEPLVPPPYNVNVRASDQLGLLNNYDYAVDSDQAILRIPYAGEDTKMACIVKALAKTGLTLDIHSADNLFETNMNKSDTDDPLDQAIINQDRWLGENLQYLNPETNKYEPTDCKTVIHDILISKGAKIAQDGGVWKIIRTKEREVTMDYRVFNSSGVYQSNANLNPLITLTGASSNNAIVYVNRSAVFDSVESYKRLNLVQEYGKRDNIIKGGEFNLWEWNFDTSGVALFSGTSQFKHWTVFNTFGLYSDFGIIKKSRNKDHYAYLTGAFDADRYIRSEQITIEKSTSFGSVLFKGAAGSVEQGSDTIRLQLRIIKDSDYWTWKPGSSLGSFSYGVWEKNAANYSTFTPQDPRSQIDFTDFEFYFDPPPQFDGTATLEVRIYGAVLGRGCSIDNVVVKFAGPMLSLNPLPETKQVDNVVNENSTLLMDETVVKFGDILNTNNNKIKNSWIVYNGYIKYADGDQTLSSLWLKKGDGNEDTLLNHLAQNIVEIRELQKERIRCEILETNQNTLSFFSTIKDTENFDKFFIWDTVTYSPKSNTWNGTALEILNPDVPDYRITKDDDFRIDEDGDFRIVDYADA